MHGLWVHVIAVASLSALCGAWFLLQRSAEASGCDGSGRCGGCSTRGGECEAREDAPG